MLHSALPRAFLAPGLSYLGGYYSEDVHPYTAASTYIPIEDPYARAAETHVFPSWQPHRSATPCPLDLSLKPPPASSTPKTEESLGEAIEVDDDEDRRSRDEVQRRLENPRYIHDNDDVSPGNEVVGLHHGSVHHIYDQLLLQKDQRHTILENHEEKSKIHQDNIRLQESPLSYASTEIPQMNSLKYNLTGQKMPMTSPTRLQSMQNYHQQLLLTPQQHLQGIHAPMTPPSTPSPPQCPRRRAREEEVISPSTTPKQAVAVEKPAQRPKKKHARRLKFDEDTSSPVSGTVILGPDEAVVTGDIDPAFNIVEVTEEARAELAKIENRLGPYQCKLCRQLHEDAFQLAQHRCSRIAHVEYRCPECDKRFSCPANLASHRRWHKPRLPNGENGNGSPATEISCTRCDAKFTRQAALRKHMSSQHLENNCSSALSPQEHSSASPKLSGASNAGPLAASPLQTEVP